MQTHYPNTRLLNPVLYAVAAYLKVDPKEMRKRSRTRQRVFARRVAVYILRRLYPHATNSQIASWFGRSDHTWVTEAIRSINELSAAHPVIARQVEELTHIIESRIHQQQKEDA